MDALAPDLLELLRCPRTGLPLTLAPADLLAAVNARIQHPGGSQLCNSAGALVRETMDGALVSADASTIYPLRLGIPVLLVDEAVALPLP